MIVSIEKQKDGSYIAYNKECDGFTALGTGATPQEAKEDFMNSIEEIKEVYLEKGDAMPDGLDSLPVFQFDLSSFFEYYPFINVTAFARSVGINDSLMRQYRHGGTYISDAQLNKIQQKIYNIGADFQSLRLI